MYFTPRSRGGVLARGREGNMVNHQFCLKLLLDIPPSWAAFDFDELFKTRLSGIKINFYILNCKKRDPSISKTSYVSQVT